MNLDDYLDTTRLIDCQGRTTHTLTLLPDGRVRIRVGAVEVFVEPRSRQLQPSTARLAAGEYGHDQIVALACEMADGVSR